jgi:hypothetical protein
MKLFWFFLFAISIMACKKNATHVPPLQGLWIEKSLRLDSMDFSNTFPSTDENKFSFDLKSRPYIDVSQNPNYPINHSAGYRYYLEGQYIFLNSFYSSSTYYSKYDFQLSDDKRSFTIKRFYSRNSLPAFIEFERIK